MLRPKKIGICSLVATIFVVVGTSGPGAAAEGAPGVFVDWREPRVVSNLEGFEGSVRIEGLGRKVEAMVAYTYPNGTVGSRACRRSARGTAPRSARV